ncbi:hypothetical protein [Streptomyces bohaiensis]|uniref:Lipoprotein n=1 Tax=Streptomyces bohaiensis TaxID=1431344 RepID=A0ABX1C5H3_9ACTN|nr:hypothetical protein [Streptomyces bohaiensis]NJQ14446.1 hypothetical protein [Streptomyces bohaiensis]
MKRHLVLPVVAAATAGLLLTSCSSGDSEPDDDIAGVQSPSPSEDDEGSEESEDADAEADTDAPDDGIDRPEIELPDDMTKEFEDVDTDDPDERAVLADQERFVAAVDGAVAEGEAGPALDFYASGDAYISAVELVERYADMGYRIGGPIRYYNRDVTLREGDTATSSSCVDFSRSYSVNLETGEEDPQSDEQGLYTLSHELNDVGTWRVVGWAVTAGGESCA